MFNKIKKGIFSKGAQPESPIKIGNNVKVKDGIKDPDEGVDYDNLDVKYPDLVKTVVELGE